MSLAAGRLRHWVTVQSPFYIQDPVTGDQVPAWIDFLTVWAAIEPLSAREFIASQAVQSKVTARITMRKRDDINATCRIVHNGKFYNIEGVLADPDSGLEYMTLPVSEGVQDIVVELDSNGDPIDIILDGGPP